MPFSLVRCYRSLSCYLLCRLFSFGQLLCLFTNFFHFENACFAPAARPTTPAWYFYILRSKKYHASQLLRYRLFLHSSSRQKATRCLILCSPRMPVRPLGSFLHKP